ncbi:unnamed protein product [Trichobilharzia regenti]|nr:unnamed protein product [Trichobilharzia regenti]
MNALCSKPDTKKDNFYELLGVSEDSSEDQILYEYRMKAREFHPDRNPGLSATLSFQKIQKAKEVLTDRNLRHLYNMWLSSDLSLSFEEYLKFEKKFQEVFHLRCQRYTPNVGRCFKYWFVKIYYLHIFS